MGKIRKSITKRFKITKNGKILRRLSGQDHSLAKKTGKRKRAGRKWIEVSKSEIKKIKRLLSY
ncbi:MAG: 50S ribosomal protein L35 [Candidatus Nealsonbacteria bacterium]|nr:50S ribosomal protein L35 [Candidatus Nealsonbacteria bacterium]